MILAGESGASDREERVAELAAEIEKYSRGHKYCNERGGAGCGRDASQEGSWREAIFLRSLSHFDRGGKGVTEVEYLQSTIYCC